MTKIIVRNFTNYGIRRGDLWRPWFKENGINPDALAEGAVIDTDAKTLEAIFIAADPKKDASKESSLPTGHHSIRTWTVSKPPDALVAQCVLQGDVL